MSDSKPPLIVIVGPTAVGKTETSIHLAKQFNGEIVSADSRLFYKFMDIGTAKPTVEERSRVPHHLIDIVKPDEIWSLAEFKYAAKRVIAEITHRSNLPFVVGGTGQYIKAITEDWVIPAVSPNRDLRSALELWAKDYSNEKLHKGLKSIDPVAAERIDPRNLRRTIRALEVIYATGKKFSDQRGRRPPEYEILTIGLYRPRKELYARIDARIDRMFSKGFIEEVEFLIDKGYSFELPSLSAIGYREIKSYIDGTISLKEAIVQIKRKSRVYVRRQANWFKLDDPEIHWYDLSENNIVQIKEDIQTWLDKKYR